MDEQTIATKLQAVKEEFDSLQAESNKNVERNEVISQRLFELRGQHEVYQSLLTVEGDPATTIKAKPQEAPHGRRK